MKRTWIPFRADPDATLALRPRARRPVLPILAASVVVLIGLCAGLWAILRVAPANSGAEAEMSLPPLADEAQLLAAPTGRLTLWRFSADPKILVAIFPALHTQAMALNRVAAFVERPGVPHDHLLGDAALHTAMGQSAEVFDTYYYGHDYRGADLARFFATAAHDGVALHAAEQQLQALLQSAGMFQPDATSALISLPPHGEGLLDDSARATILDHELSHGAYFTDPVYAAYVAQFWSGLTEKERSTFRYYLGGQGYDMSNDDLMRNETQAYLVFTPDPRMFDIVRLGLPEAKMLRRRFLEGLPVAWLRRDAAGE